ncbi:hypothetical protein ACN27F_15170 [Solwaraspora sp. WMMB335]|uniref:hypothetical protein n=1 Tax=Solwaraspora sp. WMMB335 TaxID=3404118 RepID=UPI003B93E101
MQPELFPEGSVLVISTYADTQTQFFYTMMYLAPADSTSCALSGTLGRTRYTRPSPHPTRVGWPQPAE